MTDPEEARQFAAETGIDVVAPAVGNMHGLLREMVSGQAHKHLDVPRIGAIKRGRKVHDAARGLEHRGLGFRRCHQSRHDYRARQHRTAAGLA